MIVLSRKAVRQAVGLLLQNTLTGTGNPAQAVYDHEVGDWGTQDPVVYVTGRSAYRHDDNDPQKGLASFGLDVHVWVRYVKDGVTEADSENTLDDIEAKVADTVLEDVSSGGFLAHDGESIVDALELGGVQYRHEVIPLRVTVMEP